MNYYPMMANLHGKQCTVIGGGPVAERKVKALMKAGAEVTVISPACTANIAQWEAEKKLTYFQRPFDPKDIEESIIVIAAANDPEVNLKVHESLQPYQWLNIVDRPDLCTFIVPALVERGDIQIAISTGGQNPGFTKRFKRKVEEWMGPEYEEYIRFLGQMRSAVLSQPLLQERKEALLRELLDDRFLVWTREGRSEHRDREAYGLIKSWLDKTE